MRIIRWAVGALAALMLAGASPGMMRAAEAKHGRRHEGGEQRQGDARTRLRQRQTARDRWLRNHQTAQSDAWVRNHQRERARDQWLRRHQTAQSDAWVRSHQRERARDQWLRRHHSTSQRNARRGERRTVRRSRANGGADFHRLRYPGSPP